MSIKEKNTKKVRFTAIYFIRNAWILQDGYVI